MTRRGFPSRSALVLGSDTRSFLSVVRSLGRYGLEVDAAWCDAGSVALRSRFLNRIHAVPPPWSSETGWLDPFNKLVGERGYDLVVPCGDPASIPLQMYKEQLQNRDHIYLLEDEAFRITQSKVLSTELASSLGIPVPGHRVVASIEGGKKFASEFGYPVVLKPTESFRSDQLLHKQNVAQVRTENELRRALERMLRSGVVQAQSYFEGVGTGVEFLADNGRIAFAFQHLRLHEPIKGGGSSYRTSIPLHPGMLEGARRIVDALRYSGVGMVEFRWNRGADEWQFLEINGRFWGSLPLALAAGADFPALLYRMRVEGAQAFSPGYRVGICSRNWERDKNWLAERIAAAAPRKHAIRVLATEALSGALRTLQLRERSDTFTIDDPGPAVAEMRSIGAAVHQRLQRSLRRRIDHLDLTRRIRRERISEQLHAANRLLFVCKGNICRSPFAAAVARSILRPEKTIESCGYYPAAGRECPEAACEAAHRLGINLRDHRSQVITRELVESADLIFVFDQENRSVLHSRFAESSRKMHYLGACLEKEVYIDDPFGCDVDRFVECYRRIMSALEQHVRSRVSGLAGHVV